MNQLSSPTPQRPIEGASLMLAASIALAGTNILQNYLIYPVGMASTGMAFWQYLIATVFALPLILRIGPAKLRTRHPVLHEIRAFVSALGVHVFVYGFAAGVPIWQMVTLLAVGPLFIVLGSVLFLQERAAPHRIIAALVAFSGAIIVSGVGAESFSPMTLIPVGAAALWAATDVLTKYLTREEPPESLTVSLLLLITPNHLLILLVATAWATLLPGFTPAGLATGFPFQLPGGTGLVLLVGLGLLTALSQYLLAFGYKLADATLLQPIGDLKVPLSAVLGWLLLGQVPSPWFWLGAALILGASVFVVSVEARTRRGTLAAA